MGNGKKKLKPQLWKTGDDVVHGDTCNPLNIIYKWNRNVTGKETLHKSLEKHS